MTLKAHPTNDNKDFCKI